MTCKCGSYAINHSRHGRDGSDGDLCDVCYWRKRATPAAQPLSDEKVREIAAILQCYSDSYALMGLGTVQAQSVVMDFNKNIIPQVRAALAQSAQSAQPQESEKQGCDPMSTKLCSYDGKPCPPKKGTSPRANSRCEENGVCQRIDLNDLPKLELSTKPPESAQPQVKDKP